MTKIYTTEELIQILATERQACLKGQRLNLTGIAPSSNPVIDQLVNTEGMQKFTAYLNFRSTVHQYQIDHQVSGVVLRHIILQGNTLTYPDLHDQLVALPNDLEVLGTAKAALTPFWEQAIARMNLYLSVNRHQDFEPISLIEAYQWIHRAAWISPSKSESRQGLEITLQLHPVSPDSYPEFNRPGPLIVAVSPGQRPIH